MIKKARLSDCLDLAALSLQVWLHTYATQGLRAKVSHYALSTFTERHFQQLLNNPACQIWVYIHEEHLVGFISVDLDSNFNDETHGYEVTTLYVSEHFQGQGVGRKLLDEIKVQHGASFWLSTWVNNQKAIDFYRNLGFKLVGELSFDLEGELHENHVFSYTST
ncbi:N-acetyltransferase family protein [Vibrio splendidus]